MQFAKRAVSILLLLVALNGPGFGQNTKIWDDGEGTGLWNHVDENWSGMSWRETIPEDQGLPDSAVFGASGTGVVTVEEQVHVNDITFDEPGYALRVQADVEMYGQLVPNGHAPQILVEMGRLVAAGPSGTLQGVEERILLNYSGGGDGVGIRLDNSKPVFGLPDAANADRWGDSQTVLMDAGLSFFDLTEAPRGLTGPQAVVTEQVGTLRYGGISLLQVYNNEERSIWPYYEPEHQTNLHIESLERLDQGVLFVNGHFLDDPDVGVHGDNLGAIHRVVVSGPTKPALINGKMVAPYMVDGILDRFLTYDTTIDGNGEVGFKKATIDVHFDGSADQTGEIASIVDWGGRAELTADRTILAGIVFDTIDSDSTIGEHTLTVTSGGLILQTIAGDQIRCNLVAGSIRTPEELVVTVAKGTTEFHGTIKASALTVSGKPGGPYGVNIYSDNRGLLVGPVALYQADNQTTQLYHSGALGEGNDLMIGAGKVLCQTEGEVYDFGQLSIASGRLDLKKNRLTTTTDGQTVRDWIYTGKLTSIGGAILQDAFGEIVEDFNTGARRIGWYESGGIVRAGYTWAGDSNVDGDVDNADIARTFSNFTGSTGTDMEWGAGDYNYDGDVDNADIATVFQHYTGAATAGLGENPDVLYDYMTGEVMIAADGATVKAFQLEIAKESLVKYLPENVDWTQLEALAEALKDLGITSTMTPEMTGYILGWSSDTVSISGDMTVSLGRILPAGLSDSEITGLFSAENIWGGPASTGGTLDLQVVPEPATMCLLSLGWVGLLRRRRK